MQVAGMELRFLELELTESILMQHTSYNIATLAKHLSRHRADAPYLGIAD